MTKIATLENRKCPWCVLEVLTMVSHLVSVGGDLEAMALLRTMFVLKGVSAEDELLEETACRVRDNQESEGDFGNGGGRWKFKLLTREISRPTEFVTDWLSRLILPSL